jgi:hypothetical protein
MLASPSQITDAPAGVPLEPSPLTPRSAAHMLALRWLYWSPVFALLVLFAQVSFLGLRPALNEAQRLAVADQLLSARHERALRVGTAISAELRARHDPVFVERQRRLSVLRREPVE